MRSKASKRQDPTAWRSTPEGARKYVAARAAAQAEANRMGVDMGLEANDLFQEWTVHILPRASNRYGWELRCEVVSPEDLAGCKPGYGAGGIRHAR